MTKPSKKLLLAIVLILLFIAGCELVGVGVMTMSGPDCGEFGPPAGLDENAVRIFDWDRLDSSLAALQDYEQTHNPDVMFALGYLHARKAATLSNDPAHSRRAVQLFTWAALCGHGLAAKYLGFFFEEGVFGLEKDPVRGACLRKVYELYRDERALVPGRVWACGLRVDSLQQ